MRQNGFWKKHGDCAILSRMNPALRICLILGLMLTGIGLGAARGTVQIGGQMILCTGEGIVISVGADGRPDGRAHVCPDMALAMMAAAVSPDPPPAPSPRARPVQAFQPATTMPARQAPPAAARDPPV